jgi:hypothetical protein
MLFTSEIMIAELRNTLGYRQFEAATGGGMRLHVPPSQPLIK